MLQKTFLLVVLILGPLTTHIFADSFKVHFIDVGYGDAILIQANESTWMIDSGDRAHAKDLQAYLNTKNITTVDHAVITHPHKNHFEGFVLLNDKILIKEVYINGDQNAEEGYLKLLQSFAEKKVPTHILYEGNRIKGGVEAVVLNPPDLSWGINGNSIVLWIKIENASILLLSDIDEKAFERIAQAYPQLKEAQYISIPHHGGFDIKRLVEFFGDKTYIVSTGSNQWGIPDEKKLAILGDKLWRTDQDGTIVLTLNQGQWSISGSK